MFLSYKNKFNLRYGFDKNESHSISELSQITGYKKMGLDVIFNKREGAYYTNPGSIRPHIKSPNEWGMARIYSAVMGGKAARVDASHLVK